MKYTGHEECDPAECPALLRARLERAEKAIAVYDEKWMALRDDYDEAVRLIDHVRLGCIPWDALQAFMDKHGGYTDLSRVGAKGEGK